MATAPVDRSARLTPTFTDGVLVCGAAIPDGVVIYAGGPCVDEQVHATLRLHDVRQTLMAPGALPRLVSTFTDSSLAPLGAARPIRQALDRVLPLLRPRLVVLAELSDLTIAGDDLSAIAASVRERLGPEPIVVAATAQRIARDFRDAIASILADLARELPAAAFAGGPVPGRATVVGYFFERGEGDHVGTVEALSGLLRAVGLDPTATWLSGAPFAGLAEAARSSLLVALPSGRLAARLLAARSGATVVELDLPVGLGGTADWLRAVATASGRPGAADEVIERGLAAAVPWVDAVAGRVLAGRRALVSAVPDWLPGLSRMMGEDYGMEVACGLERAREPAAGVAAAAGAESPERTFDPSADSLLLHARRAVAGRGLDVLVGSSWEWRTLAAAGIDVPFVEFGFPSLAWRCLRPAPLAGFDGALCWAERLSSALLARA